MQPISQPYVNAPVVLVFCMNPDRVKMNFPPNILKKFSLQDATLAGVYSQLDSTCTRFKFHMDRNDRRRKSYDNTRHKIYTFINSMSRISSKNTSAQTKKKSDRFNS